MGMPGMLMNPVPWPQGARCAVAITWDVDAESGLRYKHGDRSDDLVATRSLLHYGPSIAVPRLVHLLQKLDISQTFFVPGWVIEQYPAAVELLVEHGHEIALHGYMHERSNDLSPGEEARLLDKSIEAYIKRVGTEPRGWRAPGFAFSRNSTELLIDAGFNYDSSLMGNDIPYLLQGEKGQLVELPIDWAFDDWPHYMHNRDFNFMMPILAPERAMEVFRSEFDAAREYGSMLITVWHPFLSGRLARIHAIVEFIEYMRSQGGVWFARLDQICDHVRMLVENERWSPSVVRMP